ncbi:hypothetical protein CAAN1_10S01838 [[Candida] anglica]|uniref:Disease resistance R13L4/SHOC-2-like LRR domain-containing protein n=1 Tax=[Candida] anglica TaxID=148631 RepID=A0ABP0EER7_9ASCO
MSRQYLSVKSRIGQIINDQLDQIKSKKTLKLNNYASTISSLSSDNTAVVPSLSEVVECIHEILYSHEPPLELERLSFQSNNISSLPSNFPIISMSLRYLDLHNNNLTEFPIEILDFKGLEILDLSNNSIWALPSQELIQLENLRALSLKENKLKVLPAAIGHLPNLNVLEISGNPLIKPSMETIKSFQKQNPDLDWVQELKSYLRTNATSLDKKQTDIAQESSQSLPQYPPHAPLPVSQSTSQIPTSSSIKKSQSIARPNSPSETRSKSSKAARRMGLIIKKPDDNGAVVEQQETKEPSGLFNSIDILNTQPPQPITASAAETTFDQSITTTPPPPANSVPSITHMSTTSPNAPTITRPGSRNRARSNTLKEIDRILEKNDIVDTEHKSGAYFRRLSTLQEVPIDETISFQSNISRQVFAKSPSSAIDDDDLKQQGKSQSQTNLHSQAQSHLHPQHHTQPSHHTLHSHSASHSSQVHSRTGSSSSGKSPATATAATSAAAITATSGQLQSPVIAELSPTKHSQQPLKRVTHHDATTIIKVSRKVLFSFSELHSSIRRFTGFCVDKKITIKMVTLLYTTKSNIDSLVENLELMEDKGGNVDQIMVSLHNSITSFKSIMAVLNDNFANFVMKIDICFIRMLYLTVYGSFNELLNAYKVLVSAPKVTDPLNFNSATANGSSVAGPGQSSSSVSSSAPVSNGINTNHLTLDPKHTIGKHSLSINTALANTNNADSLPSSNSVNVPSTSSSVSNADTDSPDVNVDEKLYNAIDIATSNAQVVFLELTKAIGKSAIASANNPQIGPAVASKVKELTNVCITSMDVSKRLQTKLITIRNNPSYTTKSLFWEDVNLFLKAIIQTFSSVKAVMKDLPILNEIRASMATLTKATKDVTILIEVSSYKSMSTEGSSSAVSSHPPLLASIPSVSNIFTPSLAYPPQQLPSRTQSSSNLSQQNSAIPAPMRTPLVATLGPAASVIMPTISGEASPMASPGIVGGSSTPQTSGQYYAKNGLNPFDGLIMANKEREETRER